MWLVQSICKLRTDHTRYLETCMGFERDGMVIVHTWKLPSFRTLCASIERFILEAHTMAKLRRPMCPSGDGRVPNAREGVWGGEVVREARRAGGSFRR